MSDRLKRILLAVGFVLVVAGIAALIWFFFFRPLVTPTPVPPGSVPPGTGTLPPSPPAVPGPLPPETGAGGLPPSVTVPGATIAPTAGSVQTILLNDAVTQQVSPSPDRNGARFYDPEDSKFYRITPEGVRTSLSDQAFPNVDVVTWGNSSDQAILSFPDGTKLHYDFRTKTQTTIPRHWESFQFSPDDQRLVTKSVAVAPGSRFLITTDPNGSNPKAVEPLGENEDKVFPAWTGNEQVIAYAETGDARGLDRQEILLVGQNHENFRALQVEGRGFLPLWSPDGSTVLYSVWNADSQYRPELWLSGGDPDNVNKDRTRLNIQTWADKCVWADDQTIYCAVPESLPTGAGLQPELFTGRKDAFYKLDLRTGGRIFLGAPEGITGGVQHPVLTSDRKHILFTDAVTGQLYDFLLQ